MSYQQPPPWQGQPPQPNTGYQQPSGPQWPPQQPGMYPQQQPMPPGGYPPQYQRPPMMPPPGPPKKKLSRRTWIIIGVIVLILVIASAANANKSTDTPIAAAPTATPIIVNSQATATPIPPTATPTPKLSPQQQIEQKATADAKGATQFGSNIDSRYDTIAKDVTITETVGEALDNGAAKVEIKDDCFVIQKAVYQAGCQAKSSLANLD